MNCATAVISFFLVTVSLLLFGDDKQIDTPKIDNDTKQLLERIEKLEKRIAELESRSNVQIHTGLYYSAKPDSVAPSGPSTDPNRFPKNSIPNVVRSTPLLPNQQVLKGWKRREFNGSFYYIVPMNEVEQPKKTQ